MKEAARISPHDSQAIVEAMAEAVSQAVEVHRRLKQPIVGARDGRIVWIRPEDIPPRALPGDDLPLPEDTSIEPSST